MTPEGEALVKIAETLARKAHKGQFRWDGTTPYIEHPEAIVKSFSTVSPEFSEDDLPIYIATAWLHDVIEDTSIQWTDLFSAKLPTPIIEAVRAMTMRVEENYLEYILRVKRNEVATEIKIRDIRHNMADLGNKQKQRKEKYLCALHILRN